MKNIKKFCLFLVIIMIIPLAACGNIENATISAYEENIIEIENEQAHLPPIEITLAAVGDIMVHGPQLQAQYDPNTGEYDFTNNFKHVEDYLHEADLAICNLETTLAGHERGYSSYPRFNTPDALADALKQAGFHLISTANNHTLDTGIKGMLRTIDALQDRGLEVIGTRKGENIENYIIKDVKGINIGLTAYTYESPMLGDQRSLNGLPIPQESRNLINSFSYEKLDEDLINLEATLDKMKDAGAELIVLCIHWGEEYQRPVNDYQRYIAQRLGNYGVDIILGSHPHVLQPIELIETSGEQGKTVVAYSMGNFLSNQRYEILKNRYTEDGIIVNIKIKKNLQKKALAIDQVTYVPTWVNRYHFNGKVVYEILPVVDVLANEEYYNLMDSQTLWRIENSKNNTLELIESVDVLSKQIIKSK